MNNQDPYRESSITAPSAPTKVSFWTVVRCFITPHSRGTQYQWYRRAQGGRWSYRHHRRYACDPWDSMWVPVPHCPAEGPKEVFGSGEYKNWSCYGGKCCCEVW